MKGKRDYYAVLGVDKNVTEAGLKSAYRKLGKQYHPDVSKDPDAAVKMQEINEAYETLSDPQKRAAYDSDSSGSGSNSGGGNRPRAERNEARDIFDDIFAGMKGSKININDSPFGFGGFGFSGGGSAKGTKGTEKSEPERGTAGGEICKRCNGKGREQVWVSSGFGRMKKVQECAACGGTGKVVNKP